MGAFAARRRGPRQILLGLLCLAAIGALFLSLGSGSLHLGPAEVWSGLNKTGTPNENIVVRQLRLPRALGAFAVGGLLALSGALIQVLLRNPLGDPYVMGVSGGAACGALLALSLGISGASLSAAAFTAALGSMLLVFTLSRDGGAWAPNRLLLTGVVLASGWGALISFLLALSPPGALPGMLFWLMGDLSSLQAPEKTLVLLAIGALIAQLLARPMNLLARGELQATSLGVSVPGLRIAIFTLASLLTASAVTQAGSIGFVGLVAPHAVRLLFGGDHRWVLPGAVLLGGTLLTLADTLARTLLAPQQLPVGVVTALIGVPAFLYLLRHQESKRGRLTGTPP